MLVEKNQKIRRLKEALVRVIAISKGGAVSRDSHSSCAFSSVSEGMGTFGLLGQVGSGPFADP